jgi:hypothetical protein
LHTVRDGGEHETETVRCVGRQESSVGREQGRQGGEDEDDGE